MKNTMKKLLSLFLVLTMTIGIAPLSGFVGLKFPELNLFDFSIKSEASTYSGSCGATSSDNVNWSLDTETGVLNITGTGAIKNFSAFSYGPWEDYDVRTVNISDGVTRIGVYAFCDCAYITSVIIPDSVTSIGDLAFANCKSLTSVAIGNQVTEIGAQSFQNCYRLTSITLPNSVTSISYNAFTNCNRLTSITIGDSVTSIGYSAFSGCSSLTDVYYNGTEEEWNEITIGSYNESLLNATIHFISEECVHNFGLWEITTEPTMTEDGVKTKTCSVCGEKETDRVPKTGITVTVTDSYGNVIKEEVISGDMTEISFNDITDGEYTVTFEKETYATREYTVTASDGTASLELKLNKTGDMNGDGKVNSIDVARANAHAKGASALSGYELACVDVNGDGKVNAIDVALINAHSKGVKSLW